MFSGVSLFFSRKHLLVFKTSWRRLQHVFSVTIFCLPWLLQEVFKTPWRRLGRCLEDISQDVLNTSWKTKNCYAEDVFKTSFRHVFKTSWRHVLKTSWRQTNCLLGISVPKKSKYISNKSIFSKSISDESKANPKWFN